MIGPGEYLPAPGRRRGCSSAPFDDRLGQEPDVLEEVLRLLALVGTPATAEILEGAERYHLGGAEATRRLAGLAEVLPGSKVLDAGSGLGGPSRRLAALYGCFVAGIDLAPRSVAVARLLAQRTGVSPSVSYRVGDARVLPFLDGLFDLVWSQLVAMEIEEREALYAEFHRVLRPGGRLALHDVVAGDAGPPLYPTLWAESADASHLLTEGETRHALASVGLRLVRLHDETGAALAVVARAQAPGSAEGAAGVLGPGSPAMAANLAQNLREGRLKVIMAVAEAAP